MLLSAHLRASAEFAIASAFSLTACWCARALQELIAIENQTELVIADASDQLVNEIRSVIAIRCESNRAA